MSFTRYSVLERSEGRQRPTFPKVEGGETFPLGARAGRGGSEEVVMLALVSLCLALVLSSPQERGKPETYDQARARGFSAHDAGRFDEYLEAFQKCLTLRPNDAGAAYNLACGHALKGETEAAFDWLAKSIEWGFGRKPGNLGTMSSDSDLDSLQADQRFQRLYELADNAARSLLPPAFIDWAGGHRGWVAKAAFSPDGRRIVSACQDGCARIWDGTSGELLLLLAGHQAAARFCAWADAGRQVMTGGNDKTLRFWDARTGDQLHVYPGIPFGLAHAIGADGRLLVSFAGRGGGLSDLQSSRRLRLDLAVTSTEWTSARTAPASPREVPTGGRASTTSGLPNAGPLTRARVPSSM